MPILRALGRMEGSAPSSNDTVALVERTGLDVQTVQLGVAALVDAEYVGGAGEAGSLDDVLPYYLRLQLREKGRRAIEQWPADDATVDGFMDALNTLMSATDDAEEKSKLAKVRDSVASVGKPTMVAVFAAFLKTQMGI